MNRCIIPTGADAAEAAARLLHEMRQQAGEQDTATDLRRQVDSLQGTCEALAATLGKASGLVWSSSMPYCRVHMITRHGCFSTVRDARAELVGQLM